MDTTHELHVIRDATRGGVGTVLYEIAGQSQVGVQIDADKIPVASEVQESVECLVLNHFILPAKEQW